LDKEDIIKQIGEERFNFIQHMKAYAIKYGKCKETFEGKCSYPHCNCLFIGLEEEEENKASV